MLLAALDLGIDAGGGQRLADGVEDRLTTSRRLPRAP
jgi:hypothetical protein